MMRFPLHSGPSCSLISFSVNPIFNAVLPNIDDKFESVKWMSVVLVRLIYCFANPLSNMVAVNNLQVPVYRSQ